MLILAFKLYLFKISLLLKSSFTSEYLSLKSMSKNLLRLRVKLKPLNTEIRE